MMIQKTVMITGCSTGIGRHLAEYLTHSGYRVIATARNLETIADLDAALKLPLDVTDNASVNAAVNQTIQRFGRIDILINNAGYAIRGAVEETTETRIHQMFNVNVYGLLRMIRAVVPQMRLQGKGHVINIGSIGGKLSMPVNGTYTASKHAVEALSDALRWELAPFGIRVVLIEPGPIKSNFLQTAHSNSDNVITNPNSVYFGLYQNYEQFTQRSRVHEPGPEVVSRVVRKVIEATKPKARYPVAVPFATRLMLLLNDNMRDYLINKAFGRRGN